MEEKMLPNPTTNTIDKISKNDIPEELSVINSSLVILIEISYTGTQLNMQTRQSSEQLR